MDCLCLPLLLVVVMAMLVSGMVAPLAQIGRDLDPSFDVPTSTQPHTYRPTQPLPSARLLKGEVLAPQHSGSFTGPTRKSDSHQFTHNNSELTTTPLQAAKGSHDGHKRRTLQYDNTSPMLSSPHHTNNSASWTLNVDPSF